MVLVIYTTVVLLTLHALCRSQTYTRASKEQNAFNGFRITFPALVTQEGAFQSKDVSCLRSRLASQEKTYVAFHAFQRSFLLELRQNIGLIAPLDLFPVAPESENTGPFKPDIDNCFAVGSVVGDSESSVAVSLCGGIQGMVIGSAGEYYIEPIKVLVNHNTGEGFPHAVFRKNSSLVDEDPAWITAVGIEGSPDPTEPDRNISHTSTVRGRRSILLEPSSNEVVPSGIRHPRSLRVEYTLEVLVVVDQSMANYHGEHEIKYYTMTVMNMVSKIFSDPSLGTAINIVITGFDILHERVSPKGADMKQMLLDFCTLQKKMTLQFSHRKQHDFAVLLTREKLCKPNQHFCGASFFSGVCSANMNCGLVEDTGLNVAFSLTQVIARSIGIRFDGDKNSCTRSTRLFAMTPRWRNKAKTQRITWSSCSREYLETFLKSQRAPCLLDGFPTSPNNENRYQNLPGQLFDLDKQCTFLYGKNASFCPSMMKSVCQNLWCQVDPESVQCETNWEGAAEGTDCGDNQWCLEGQCVPQEVMPRPVDGQWGSWGSWSECSRSCGLGVSLSYRECDNPRPSFSGKTCAGERTRYRTCDVRACLSPTKDPRQEQCAEFNDVPYKGMMLNWTAYFSLDQPCALYCQAEGLRGYVRMRSKVADGTLCFPNKHNLCIDGKCMNVGCDRMFGSGMVEDRCGVCNGTDSTCDVVKGVWLLPSGVGYQKVTEIPKGSLNIRVAEQTSSLNVLALQDENGQLVMNGGFQTEMSGFRDLFGTVVLYEKTGDLDSIWIKGPLMEPVVVSLLFQAKNPGVVFSYSRPRAVNELDSFTQSLEKPRYEWQMRHWSPCSVSCGRGIRHRTMKCVHITSKHEVDHNLCNPTKYFHLPLECDAGPCPVQRSLIWVSTEWSPCSVPCGGGSQRRSVYCTSVSSDASVPGSIKRGCAGPPPPSEQACNIQSCMGTAIWQAGPWTKCSSDCGTGLRIRQVVCVSGLNGSSLSDSACNPDTKPTSHEECSSKNCEHWIASSWSSCSAACGSGAQRRCVFCYDLATSSPSDNCNPLEKPSEHRPCFSRC